MSNETSNNGSKISIVVLVIALIGSWIYFVNTHLYNSLLDVGDDLITDN